MSTGFAIFAHGSRIESANTAVRNVAARFAAAGGYPLVEAAFLELAEPDLAGAVSRLAARGAGRVVVIPYFLTLGMHLKRDLPRLVAEISQSHHGIPIEVTPPLDGHPAIASILLARAGEALANGGSRP